MVTISQAEEYLSIVGALEPSGADDRDWLLTIANAYRHGFVTGLDWDSDMGRVMMEMVDSVYPEFVEWLSENNIDPDTFMRPGS